MEPAKNIAAIQQHKMAGRVTWRAKLFSSRAPQASLATPP